MPTPDLECPRDLVFGHDFQSSERCTGCMRREPCEKAYEAASNEQHEQRMRNRRAKYMHVPRPENVASHQISGYDAEGGRIVVLVIPKLVQSVRVATCGIKTSDYSSKLTAYLEIKYTNDDRQNISIFLEDMDLALLRLNQLAGAIEMQNYAENTIVCHGESIELPLKGMAWGRESED